MSTPRGPRWRVMAAVSTVLLALVATTARDVVPPTGVVAVALAAGILAALIAGTRPTPGRIVAAISVMVLVGPWRKTPSTASGIGGTRPPCSRPRRSSSPLTSAPWRRCTLSGGGAARDREAGPDEGTSPHGVRVGDRDKALPRWTITREG
jgi:hypothetical protein